jgi:GNAT superfamily N-acetyltransferase
MTTPGLHPQHDAVAQEVRGWYANSAPEIDFVVEHLSSGYLSEVGAQESRLILTVDDPAGVAAALAQVRSIRPADSLTIWVDDRQRAARLDAALQAAGCEVGDATTHLALVGDIRSEPGPAGLDLVPVEAGDIDAWASLKIQCFDDLESVPGSELVAAEAAMRRSEEVVVDLFAATLDHEWVGVLAYYNGVDQLVFNLGTRVPFRHRGIAQAVLAHWVERGRRSGCRSMMINAHDDGRPAALYRRLGFVDEIYWYRKYELPAS